jgi:hypothetical protein
MVQGVCKASFLVFVGRVETYYLSFMISGIVAPLKAAE